MVKNCLKCNKEFSKNKNRSLKDWQTAKFCSKSCANSVNANKQRLAEYVKNNGSWNKGKGTGLRLMINKECLNCKKEYSVLNSRKNKSKFCSHKCSSEHRNENKTNEYKKIRKSFIYKKWRTSVFERDNYTCVMCNKKGGYLNADHILPFALYPEKRLDVNNGRTLCLDCHKKTPTFGGSIKKLKQLQEV